MYAKHLLSAAAILGFIYLPCLVMLSFFLSNNCLLFYMTVTSIFLFIKRIFFSLSCSFALYMNNLCVPQINSYIYKISKLSHGKTSISLILLHVDTQSNRDKELFKATVQLHTHETNTPAT